MVRTGGAGHNRERSRDVNIRTAHEEILSYELRKKLIRHCSPLIRQDLNLPSQYQDIACTSQRAASASILR